MDFEEFYDDTVANGANEELTDLIRIHMGEMKLNQLREWLKDAFDAGKQTQQR